jgi:hypothetical protein
MKRETRFNLVFLCIFLAVAIPGGVKLFKKKLDPSSPPLFMPDYVRRRLPYMASQLSPPQVVRYVPDKTGQWVGELARARAGADVLMHGRDPIISSDHLIQLATLKPIGEGTAIGLLVWDTRHGTDASGFKIEVRTGDQTATITVTVHTVSVPDDVHKELKYEGVIRPPREVLWLTATLAKGPHRPLEVRITHSQGEEPGTSTILLPPE